MPVACSFSSHAIYSFSKMQSIAIDCMPGKFNMHHACNEGISTKLEHASCM